jgi:hypothetical protein
MNPSNQKMADDEMVSHAENFRHQYELIKTEIKIKNTKRWLCLSCCLFSPVLLPRLYALNNKKQKLLDRHKL